MEETPFIDVLSEEAFSRRGLLKRGVVAGVGMTALAGLGIEAGASLPELTASFAPFEREFLDRVRSIQLYS